LQNYMRIDVSSECVCASVSGLCVWAVVAWKREWAYH
jgi:hypothetical protein